MTRIENELMRDVHRMQSLDIIPTILELCCRTTEMGFSAVARVTEDRWIACVVRDEIDFGLNPGDELKIETTICNEIRQHGNAVLIDSVANDPSYATHHTPALYGFQSYISVPIIRKDGSFFGTLCALDPNPRSIKSRNIDTMFRLYADLISFYISEQEQDEKREDRLKQVENRLTNSLDDARQFSHVSAHTLQEPLRKMRMYTDLMIRDNTIPDNHDIKKFSHRVNDLAADFSNMIEQLSSYSDSQYRIANPVELDTNRMMGKVKDQLESKLLQNKAVLKIQDLPPVLGEESQLIQVFFHLLDNSLNFKRAGIDPVVEVFAERPTQQQLKSMNLDPLSNYCLISLKDNGTGIDPAHQARIFDLFSKLNPRGEHDGFGLGLTLARRIIHKHHGAIDVSSVPGEGSEFRVYLPTQQ